MSTSITKIGGSSEVSIKDGANLDAFSRLRISNPLTLFASQFTYNLNPLLFQQLNTGAGAISYDSTNRCASFVFSGASDGDTAYMQSYEYLPYQPSKSQLVLVTFNMIENSPQLKFAGLSDGNNGFEFQNVNNTNQFVIYSETNEGDDVVDQSAWNLDKLDGTGPSGIILDITKVQILVIDFQALYVGRVRMGFDIDGKIYYAHEFNHANIDNYPYIQTANLPVRCGMLALDGSDTSMKFICCAVVSEGGTEDVNTFGYTFAQSTPSAVAVSDASFTHMMSLRPRLTYEGLINRVRVAYIDVEFHNGGNQTIEWKLVIGQTLTGTTTFNNVNTTYSTVEYNIAATASGTPLVVIDGGYVTAGGGGGASVSNTFVASRYPITLDAAGNHRNLGTITLIAKSVSGTQNCRASIKFREIR